MSRAEKIKKIIEESTHVAVVRYGCCGAIFAMCIDGCQDAEWDRNARKYRMQGHVVELIPHDENTRFGTCECSKQNKTEESNPDQLKIEL